MDIQAAIDKIKALADSVSASLSGEPARVIGYGSAVVIYIVAKASGKIADVSFDVAISQAAAAIVLVGGVVETIRRYVSPAR